MTKPLCFVLMPFGSKPDPTGRPNIDFDEIYHQAIEPAVIDAGLEPIRGDKEELGGIIHKPMFERLMLCEYAVADLTTANANVFYELGVRHTSRPRSTQAIFAKHQPIPFDVAHVRALPYELGKNNRFTAREAAKLKTELTARLQSLRQGYKADEPPVDSPIFQLIDEWKPGKIARRKTEVFMQQVHEDKHRKSRMTAARDLPRDEAMKELAAVEADIGDIDLHEIGASVDLMLSYRAVKAWPEMIALYERMPGELKRQVMVREQLALALNRRAGDKSRSASMRESDRKQAQRILEEVIDEKGPSSETNGLLGRIYKDQWRDTGKTHHLKKAADTYYQGFRADWRDAYPGINAATLFELLGDAESLAMRDQIAPVVRFAVEQRLLASKPDYWDHASMLELAVLQSDEPRARAQLDKALSAVREVWQPETTAGNLSLIRDARAQRGIKDLDWLDTIIAELAEAAK